MATDLDDDALAPRRRRRKAEGASSASAKGAAKRSSQTDGEKDRQFIGALARGLDVLSAFKAGDGPLGNQELASRTGIPKPTVSRLAYTLTELGYLTYSPRLNTYELGGRTLALGYSALSNLDVRRIARPYMAEIAKQTNLNVGLALRDGLMMLNVETCDGDALVGVRLFPGSRMPIATTAVGRAFLSAIAPSERQTILNEISQQHGDDWAMVSRAIDKAIADIGKQGFCLSIGDWQKDINGVGSVIPMPDGRGVYAMNVGGPAYLTSERQLREEVGPMLAKAIQAIRVRLGEAN